MEALGEQAEGISRIMTTISDIADQTNLLALNAAIEAARAGTRDAVLPVADEVRKLAETTMSATTGVGSAIGDIQKATGNNIRHVEQTVALIVSTSTLADSSGAALEEIVSMAVEASDKVRTIATAAEEQSSASEEITRAVGRGERYFRRCGPGCARGFAGFGKPCGAGRSPAAIDHGTEAG